MEKKRHKFIVAKSFKHARCTAEIDWKWQRASNMSWINEDNQRVRYISSIEQLKGLENFTIYLGFDWQSNKEIRPNFYEFVASMGSEIITKYQIRG